MVPRRRLSKPTLSRTRQADPGAGRIRSSPPEQRSRACAAAARLPLVNIHDRVQQLERLLLGTLERVAPDDRTEPATGVDLAHVADELFVGFPGSARENHDAPPVECRLNDVLHAS